MGKNLIKFYLLEINAENQRIKIPNIFVLKFPSKLHEFLTSIKPAKSNEFKNTHISPLSRAIRSKFTDIITTDDRINYKTLDNPWIYSFNQINIDVLKVIIKEWLEDRLNYKNKGDQIVIPDSCFNELEWKTQDIEVDFNVNEMGTSDPSPKSIVYNFLMSYIGHKLSGNLEVTSKGKRKDCLDTESTFNFYYVSTSSQGTELISWPFKEYKGYYWTYKIVLTLQTIPFSAKSYINVSVELLRFCQNKVYNRKHGITAYIKLPNTKTRGNNDVTFIKSQLKQYSNDNWNWAWETGLIKAMEGMLCKEIPKPNELIDDPSNFLLDNNGFTLGIPLGSHLRNFSYVGGGVSCYDESNIVNKIKEVFSQIDDPIFNIIGDFLIREDFYFLNKITKRDRTKDTEDFPEFRISKLPDTIEAYYYTEEWLSKCISGFKKAFINDYDIDNSGYEFILKSKKQGKIKRIIIVPVNMKDWDNGEETLFQIEPNKENYNTFVKTFKTKIKKSNEIIGALFELKHEKQIGNFKESAFKNLIDPKLTIRRLMAEKNRLTQFITPPDLGIYNDSDDSTSVKDEHKFISGIKDIMRQIGVINKNISDYRVHSDKDVIYIGLWFYKGYKRKFPILLAIVKNDPYIAFYKEEDEKEIKWCKYSQGQIELAIAAGEVIERNRKYNDINLKGFVIRAIENIRNITNIDDVILFTVAQNCRKYIKWFTNGLFGNPDATLTITTFDEEDMDEEKYNSLIKGQSFKDYQIVRLRNKQPYETPGWTWTKDGVDMPNVFGYSLCEINKQTFYSVQHKPHSFQPGGNHIRSTKVDSPKYEFKKQGVLEISIPSIKGELKESDIARMTHFLRDDTSFQYKGATEFPLPVHLAKSACEYADAYYEELKFSSKDGSLKEVEFRDDFDEVDQGTNETDNITE